MYDVTSYMLVCADCVFAIKILKYAITLNRVHIDRKEYRFVERGQAMQGGDATLNPDK